MTKPARPLDQVPTLTVDEAAAYIGVSVSQFRALAPICGLQPRKIMGRLLYLREHIDQYLEAQWQGTESAQAMAPSTGSSLGGKLASRARNRSEQSQTCAKVKSERSPAAKLVSLPSPSTPPQPIADALSTSALTT
jgi:hypothetical protein